MKRQKTDGNQSSPSGHFLPAESMDEDEREASVCIEKHSSMVKERGHSVIILSGNTKCVVMSCSDPAPPSDSSSATSGESVEQLVNNPVGADLLVILSRRKATEAKVGTTEAKSEDGEINIANYDYPQSFFCHSRLLTSHSGFFQSLLSESHFKEAHERVVEILLPCSDHTSFIAMLALLYTGGTSHTHLNPHTALGVCANLDYLAVTEPVMQTVQKYISDNICAIVHLCDSGGVSQHMLPFLKFQVMANAIDLHLTSGKTDVARMKSADIVRMIEKGAKAAQWSVKDLVGVFHEWASREPVLSLFRELSFQDLYDLSREISYSSMLFEHLFFLAKKIVKIANSEHQYHGYHGNLTQHTILMRKNT